MATQIPDKKHFEAILSSLKKNFGEGYATRGLADPELKGLPTGHDDLDSLLTRGTTGFYKGGIVELMGSEGSGKTSIALRAVGIAQKRGAKCCWFDCESAFDEYLATLNGVNPQELIIPELAEAMTDKSESGVSLYNVNKILEMFYQSIAKNAYDIVVLDSVAGLAPERILTDDFYKDPDKAGVAEVARSMSSMLRKIAPACKQTETTAIFINQLRDQPGQYVQNRFHTPGGRALKFFAHQRISIEKITGQQGEVRNTDDEGHDELIGHYARCVIVKNKKAPPVQPGTVIEVPIYYKEYFPDNAKKCYDLARKLQVITIRNGTLTWKDSNGKILEELGESVLLSKIRDQKLENRLAASCVECAEGERNQNLKSPVRVPSSIQNLANIYKGTVSNDKKEEVIIAPKSDKKSKKKSPPALDLSDLNDPNEDTKNI